VGELRVSMLDHGEIGWDGVNWIGLAQDTDVESSCDEPFMVS
jgi:hypothetical protein